MVTSLLLTKGGSIRCSGVAGVGRVEPRGRGGRPGVRGAEVVVSGSRGREQPRLVSGREVKRALGGRGGHEGLVEGVEGVQARCGEVG